MRSANLGDHWLGEEDFFHDCVVKVPLIIADPSAAADATRGAASDALVEAIDLVPTFVEYFGGEPQPHVVEGRSLPSLLHGPAPASWRRLVHHWHPSENAPRGAGSDSAGIAIRS